MSSARRVGPGDYSLIHSALTELTERLQKSDAKSIYAMLEVDTAVRSLLRLNHAYIVGDSFLVVFDLDTPWYSDTLLLHEMLVLRLLGDAPFAVVPEFLEQAAREAGAEMVVVGTALAKSDRALASLYQRHGFRPAASTLTKEI